MKKKRLITASVLSLAFTSAAVHLEWTGYDAFDREEGKNPLCVIDPGCRQLTTEEISLARNFFGDRINYNRVKIFNRPYMWLFGHNYDAITPNGNIYMVKPEERRSNYASAYQLSGEQIYIHEMTHVAQHQGGMNIPKLALLELVKHAFNYRESYKYSITTPLKFNELNLEQQAELMEDYSFLRSDFASLTTFPTETSLPMRTNPYGYEWLKARCDEMALYEKKLTKNFPVGRDSLCP